MLLQSGTFAYLFCFVFQKEKNRQIYLIINKKQEFKKQAHMCSLPPKGRLHHMVTWTAKSAFGGIFLMIRSTPLHIRIGTKTRLWMWLLQ